MVAIVGAVGSGPLIRMLHVFGDAEEEHAA